MGLYIEDGMTLTDVIPALPGVFEATRYTYRPALSTARTRIAEAAGADERMRVTCEIVANHLVEFPGLPSAKRLWPKQLERLNPAALSHILNAILSYSAPSGGGESPEEADAKN